MAVSTMLLHSCADTPKQRDSISAVTTKPTTLDSMQGTWISMDDSLAGFSVKGRTYHALYLAENDTLVNEFSRIYFSDTIVNGMEYLFNEIKIDTTKLSGNYFIIVSNKGKGRFWCYECYGFYKDASDTTTISIGDTWARRRPTVYFLKNKK